jgi:hypothetical protein
MHMAGGGDAQGGRGMHVHPVHPPWVRHCREPYPNFSSGLMCRVPEKWKRISWRSTTLGFWYTELLERDGQFKRWCFHGRPKVRKFKKCPKSAIHDRVKVRKLMVAYIYICRSVSGMKIMAYTRTLSSMLDLWYTNFWQSKVQKFMIGTKFAFPHRSKRRVFMTSTVKIFT